MLLSTVGGARADSPTVTYSYDALGRLTVVVYSNDRTITYNYDATGNRTQTAVQYTYPKLTWSSSATCPSNCWGSSTWSTN
jgi:YD repeat-containing protein